jgi:hypothetical protein
MSIFRLAVVLMGAACLYGCSTFTTGWRNEQLQDQPEPDVVIRTVDATTGYGIYSAKIKRMELDSAWTTGYNGCCGLYGLPGDSASLHITHEEYVTVDTAIVIPDDAEVVYNVLLVSNVIATGQPDHDSGAYREGWDAAETSLRANDACIHLSGGLRISSLNVDTATGLPLRGNFTCIVDDHIMAYSEGHNDRIRLYIDRHGLPGNSKKPWLSLILDPKDYFRSVSKSGHRAKVYLGDSAVPSPDKTVAVGVGPEPGASDEYAQLRIMDEASEEFCFQRVFGNKKLDHLELAWGPPGSGLLVVKARKKYFVIDIRNCELLNLD